MNGRVLVLAGGTLAALAVFARTASAESANADAANLWTGNGALMYSDKIKKFAEAIAYAEGWYASGNTIPKRLNNPGDVKISSVPSVGSDEHGHLKFATAAQGWEALYRQLQLIVDGRSRVYNLSMTIADMAAHYAGDSGPWAANVARRLSVPASTVLAEVLT